MSASDRRRSPDDQVWYGNVCYINPNPHTVPLIPNPGHEGRARDSRPPQPHPPGDLFLTGGPDESR
jgi:hypothetical protein